MNCTICDKPIILNDGVYMCEGGHMMMHSQEIARAIGDTSTQSKSLIFAEKFANYDSTVIKLIVHYHIFHELKKFFLLCPGDARIDNMDVDVLSEDDLYYRILLKYFKFENGIITEENGLLTPTSIFAIVYYMKRINEEKSGQVYYLNKFLYQAKYFPYIEILNRIISTLRLENHKCLKVLYSDRHLKVHAIMRYLKVLSEEGWIGLQSPKVLINPNRYIELKRLFRLGLRRDEEMIYKYYKDITAFFELEEDKIMDAYFKKWIYSTDINYTFFLAEIEVCVFLIFYYEYFDLKFPIKEAQKKMKKHFLYEHEDIDTFMKNVKEIENINIRAVCEDFKMEFHGDMEIADDYTNIIFLFSSFLGLKLNKFKEYLAKARERLYHMDDVLHCIKYHNRKKIKIYKSRMRADKKYSLKLKKMWEMKNKYSVQK
ncbi:hypothetical protein TCON_0224 [Astathelohania contejeani]|uniref:Uncharacterized protein n=1 Tax=Astathelohania contejeani TaxID=164912 RepID=A0ABQ7I287_9MICR|nr:hypothetical protein TCON_0224 [Thelohania contejeani]